MKIEKILNRKVPYSLPFIPFFFVLLQYGLSFIDILIYGIYRSLVPTYGGVLADGRIYVVIRLRTIAKLLGISESAVKRARQHLAQKGLIEIQRAGLGRTSKTIVYELISEEASADSKKGSSEIPSEGVDVISAESATEIPNNNISPIDILSLSLPENVILSPAEYAHLGKIMGEHRDAYIRRYAQRKADKGYTFPNDYDALVNWWSQDREQWTKPKKRKQQQSRPKVGDAGNSFDENDFFDAALKRSFGGTLPPSSQK